MEIETKEMLRKLRLETEKWFEDMEKKYPFLIKEK